MSQRESDEFRGDAALLSRLRNGESTAFESLVDSYVRPLIGHSARIVGSVEVAREIVQEVFLHLWKIRENIPSDWDITAYLYGLTRRRSINIARADISARQRDYRWLRELQIVSDQESVQDDGTPNVFSEERTKVWLAANNLPPRCREVFFLVWDRRLSYSEISHLLGVAEPTVRRHMSRALHLLSSILGPREKN